MQEKEPEEITVGASPLGYVIGLIEAEAHEAPAMACPLHTQDQATRTTDHINAAASLRRVDASLCITYQGSRWSVMQVPGACVGDLVHVWPAPQAGVLCAASASAVQQGTLAAWMGPAHSPLLEVGTLVRYRYGGEAWAFSAQATRDKHWKVQSIHINQASDGVAHSVWLRLEGRQVPIGLVEVTVVPTRAQREGQASHEGV